MKNIKKSIRIDFVDDSIDVGFYSGLMSSIVISLILIPLSSRPSEYYDIILFICIISGVTIGMVSGFLLYFVAIIKNNKISALFYSISFAFVFCAILEMLIYLALTKYELIEYPVEHSIPEIIFYWAILGVVLFGVSIASFRYRFRENF